MSEPRAHVTYPLAERFSGFRDLETKEELVKTAAKKGKLSKHAKQYVYNGALCWFEPASVANGEVEQEQPAAAPADL